MRTHALRGATPGGAASAIVNWLTSAGLVLAALSLAGIAAIYCYEVAVRYLLNSPTRWGSDVVSYLLCWSIFLAVPELTRRNAHVAITIITDHQNRASKFFSRLASGLAFVACLVATYINTGETVRQITTGVSTLAAVPMPKWIVSAPIAFGFALSAWYFAVAALGQIRQSKGGTFA